VKRAKEGVATKGPWAWAATLLDERANAIGIRTYIPSVYTVLTNLLVVRYVSGQHSAERIQRMEFGPTAASDFAGGHFRGAFFQSCVSTLSGRQAQ
jgi:hypothetical protein